jgi:hypothetical protein
VTLTQYYRDMDDLQRTDKWWGLECLFANSRMFGFAGVVIFAVLAAQACNKTKPAPPTTVTLVDQDWPDQESRRRRNEELRQFTNQTGIRVEVLPSPETAGKQPQGR